MNIMQFHQDYDKHFLIEVYFYLWHVWTDKWVRIQLCPQAIHSRADNKHNTKANAESSKAK